MNKILLAAASIGLALGVPAANAAFTIAGSVGGAPTGVKKVNFDNLTPGTAGGIATNGNGTITVTSAPDGGVVIGSAENVYAPPFLSGGNGLGFGAPNQADGPNVTPYLQVGNGGSVTLSFGTPQLYLGVLWGSVDAENQLEFFLGGQSQGIVTGAQVKAAPDGNQGVQGTLYVNITSTLPFDRVVASSPGKITFEFDNVAFDVIPPQNCVVADCVPTTNPAGNHIPTAGANPKSGQNPDGFYELQAVNICNLPQVLNIYIKDSAESKNGSCGGAFQAGPYKSGDRIKLTQSPGQNSFKGKGPGVIVDHVNTKGDPLLVVTDENGKVLLCTLCFLPPKPK